ncbi:MAG: type II/IV secretion system ATPase subunit, partial [Thermoplasmatales archaeon]
EKCRERKIEKSEEKEPIHLDRSGKKKGKEIIEERKNFGWNGLGSRKIVFDHDINEYLYEVSEPILNEDEAEIKNELSRLFKMLSDENITDMDEDDKKKYLEETLEQIIVDNDVKFYIEKKEPKDEKKRFSLKKGKNKDEKKNEEIKTEPKDEKKRFSLKKEKNKPEKKIKLKPEKKKTKMNLKIKKRELSEEEKKLKNKIFYHIFREFLGYGRIDIVMEDEGIEDISCDGDHVPIFLYHKKYSEITTNIKFADSEELDSFVIRLAQICGKQISIYSPIVDGKLPDGSRLQTTLGKTVTRRPTFTIRRFKENPLTPIDLIEFQSFSLDMAAYFWMAIERGTSILFCGGTASGKTTALNALSLFIPPQHKIISIEDTREVNLPHQNWIPGTTRQGFSASDDKTGKDIDMFDLIRAALRQRPKVVMVGEVRGREAYSLFQAMATGHTAYSTVHASTIHTLIQRLENPPISLPRALLTSLDMIVFQNAIDLKGKTVRRMTSVTEIIKLDPDTNQLIFMEPFRWISKTDDRFESSGTSKILNNIRLQNSWSEEQLSEELENRKIILEWMIKNNMRDYKEFGRIVSYYSKYPEDLLKKVREEMKK